MNPHQITFHEISHGSPDWKAVLEHRDRILRRPLNLTLGAVDLANEEYHRHFICRCEMEIVAGLIACPPRDGSIKIRQMWVKETVAGIGIGRRLLSEVAEIFRNENIETLTLHARETARGFYERCGYQVVGESFIEVGILHYPMLYRLRR